MERELWGYKTEMGALNASVDGLARAWARANIVGRLAAERQPDILGHINTDHTARDMLRITEAYGRSKLQYWGFSYVSFSSYLKFGSLHVSLSESGMEVFSDPPLRPCFRYGAHITNSSSRLK